MMKIKNKKVIISLGILVVLIVSIGLVYLTYNDSKNVDRNKELMAMVLYSKDNEVMLMDNDSVIYTFRDCDMEVNAGDDVLIEYTGLLDKNKEIQDCSIIDYKTIMVNKENNGIPSDWMDNGIFSKYYILAYNKLKTLSLDEKIGQILLVRYPDSNQAKILEEYKFAGYVFFEKDFRDKTKEEVINMISELQSVSDIPILTAVDEEGGSVVRVSSNKNLASEKFKSPREVYASGGFDAIKEDTINKSKLLKSLGINLNLAPVVDVSTNPSDYMYARSLGEGTDITSTYAKTVIDASRNTGVSYTLKHFPGYGNNADTHTGSSVDSRNYDEIIKNDIPPFKAGVNAGAEAVLVSHNIVNSIDSDNPASLSPLVHNLLRDEVLFTGIVMTDDLSMGATSSIDNAVVKAILAGNDLIITTDYENDIANIKKSISDGSISEDIIDKLAFRVIAWKYYKGLMFENQK